MTETSDLATRLRVALARHTPATVQDEQARRAAVAVVVTREADPAVLLVRRQERAGDPWSGHVAFPGGFSAPTDGSVITTAARETEEETGLVLAHEGEHLGQLDDVAPRSIHLPRIVVTPVVFAVQGRPDVSAHPEIAEVAWVPVQLVFDPANRRPFILELPSGERRQFESISASGFVIWGLTERVLAQIPLLIGS